MLKCTLFLQKFPNLQILPSIVIFSYEITYIQKLQIGEEEIMNAHDMVSLFTNVPVPAVMV